jgi:hypothetical protein
MLKVAVSLSYLCRVVALLLRQAIEIWFVSERAGIHFRNVECRRTAFSSAENRTGRISLVTPPLPDFSTRISICALGRPVGIAGFQSAFLAVLRSGRGR